MILLAGEIPPAYSSRMTANETSLEEYAEAVAACYTHLAIGALFPSLKCCEKWVAKHKAMPIGGKATEAAFDALRRFGKSLEEIQKTA